MTRMHFRILFVSVLLLTALAGCSSGEKDPAENQTAGDADILYWKSKMDPSFVSRNPGTDAMGMPLVPVRKGDPGSDLNTLELSGQVIQRIGVRTAPIEKRRLKKTIRSVGRVTYDETRLARVNLKYDGWIEELFVDETGVFVKKGDPMFTVYSPELTASAEEFLQVLDRAKAGPHMAHLARSARTRLRQFDFSEKQIDEIAAAREVPPFLTVFAPRTGYVIHKSVEDGSYVRKGVDLFEIADLTKIWVTVDIYEFEVPWVREGQDMMIRLNYLPGEEFHGVVDFIYPFLDTATRTIRVRAVFDNPGLRLKPGMFATGFLEGLAETPTLIIPSEAVLHQGDRNVAFVSLGEGRFESRDLTLGREGDGGDYALLAGIKEGERIVLSGQFLIDSESRLKEAAARMLGPDALSINSTNQATEDVPSTPQPE